MPRKIVSSYILSTQIFIYYAYVFVLECPRNQSLWMQREHNYSCRTGTFYHCLRTTKNLLIEECLPLKVLSAENGCPVAKVVDPIVFIEQLRCHTTINGCPRKHGETVQSNSVLRYPSCIRYNIEELVTGIYSTRDADNYYSATTDYVHNNSESQRERETTWNKVVSTSESVTSPLRTVKNIASSSVKSRDVEITDDFSLSPETFITNGSHLNPYIIVAVVIGTLVLILVFVFCVVVYVQRMKNERYRIRFERAQYLPSIPNNIDQPHEYREVDIYDVVEDLDEVIDALHGKNTNSSIFERESEKTVESRNDDYNDFIGIQESSNSDSSYLEPNVQYKNDSCVKNETEDPLNLTFVESNRGEDSSRAGSEDSEGYVEPNPPGADMPCIKIIDSNNKKEAGLT